mmetsp:Transcript_9748/g.15841  ORF Transcript_9748/g.15841 Transcript_9748/m.15841 type:complete len:156 (+) Transcript_9748:81-548(+)
MALYDFLSLIVVATAFANADVALRRDDPLDRVKQMMRGRIQHLRTQQTLEAGPAALCKSQKDECDKNIAREQTSFDERADAIRAAGGDVDGCIYGSKYSQPCYELKQAKKVLDNYLHEKELLIRKCAYQPESPAEKAQRRADMIDSLHEAHAILR